MPTYCRYVESRKKSKCCCENSCQDSSNPNRAVTDNITFSIIDSQASATKTCEEISTTKLKQSVVDELHAIEKAWVKDAIEYSKKDKKCSEKNGRCFVEEWFESYDWLVYIR